MIDRRGLILGLSALPTFSIGALADNTPTAPQVPSMTPFSPKSQDLEKAAVPITDIIADKPPQGEIVFGDPNAPVTVVEYAAVTCPHCSAFHTGKWPTLRRQFVDSGKVRWIFREYILDRVAAAAFMLARCSSRTGMNATNIDKYQVALDVMMAEQADLIQPLNGSITERLLVYAKKFGVLPEQLNECLSDEKLFNGLLSVKDDAIKKFNVLGTPTFFVKDYVIRGNASMDTFVSVLTG